jgi:hypothetical protein
VIAIAPPAELTETQLLVARRIADGEAATSVAKELGLRLIDVLEWRYHPAFVVYLKHVREAQATYASARVAGLVDKAIDSLRMLLDSENEKIVMASSKELLRIAGIGPEYSVEADLHRRRENAKLALRFVHELLAGNTPAQEAVTRLIEESE